jgi:hypothetical protein
MPDGAIVYLARLFRGFQTFERFADSYRPKQPEIDRSRTIDEWRTKVAPEISTKIAEVAAPAMAEFGMNSTSYHPAWRGGVVPDRHRPASQTASGCFLEQT